MFFTLGEPAFVSRDQSGDKLKSPVKTKRFSLLSFA